MNNSDQSLIDFGVDKITYYYHNCSIVGNIFTVCLLISNDKKILSRGVCIRSLMDPHNKQFARNKSKSRAINAIFKKEKSSRINDFGSNCYYFEVRKYFKVKSDKIKNELESKICKLGFSYNVYSFDGGYDKIGVNIPYFYPVSETAKYFEYKSEFSPEPTNDEKLYL